MKIYLVIEMADCELLAIHCLKTKKKANSWFIDICKDNAPIEEHSNLNKELSGALRLAGDDAYSVELLEVTPK